MRGGGKGERRKLSTHRSVRTPRGGASSQSGTPHPITPPCLPSTPGQTSSTHSHTDLQFIYRSRSYRYQLSSEKLSRPTASMAYYKDKSKLAGRRSQKVWNSINENLSKDKTQGGVSQVVYRRTLEHVQKRLETFLFLKEKILIVKNRRVVKISCIYPQELYSTVIHFVRYKRSK